MSLQSWKLPHKNKNTVHDLQKSLHILEGDGAVDTLSEQTGRGLHVVKC